jgi:hypothetical protein
MKKLILLLVIFLTFGCAALRQKPDDTDYYREAEKAGLDIDTDDNSAVDITYGGTNATSASAARTNLGFTFDNLSDPGASKTFTMGAYTITFNSTTDGWGGLTIYSNQGTLSTETKGLTIKFDPAKTDTNQTWMEFIADTDGSPVTVFKFAGAATRPQLTGDFDLLSSGIDFDSIDNLTIASTSLNDTDAGWTVAQTFTDIDASGSIQGAINVITDADGISLTNAQMNSYLIMTGAGEVTLPDVCDSATGKWIKVKARDAAEQVEMVVTDTSDLWVLSDGTETTANDEADLATAAGSWAVFICLETNKWYVDGENGTVTDGGVPD